MLIREPVQGLAFSQGGVLSVGCCAQTWGRSSVTFRWATVFFTVQAMLGAHQHTPSELGFRTALSRLAGSPFYFLAP